MRTEFFTVPRVTFPSLDSQQCFLTAHAILLSFSLECSDPESVNSEPPCVHGHDSTPPTHPRLLFRPQLGITFPESHRQSGVTSISLSPAGEGSLLRLDRLRSFPSGARGGLLVSPSFAGVEGPLCELYSPGVRKGSVDMSEALRSVSAREISHQKQLHSGRSQRQHRRQRSRGLKTARDGPSGCLLGVIHSSSKDH